MVLTDTALAGANVPQLRPAGRSERSYFRTERAMPLSGTEGPPPEIRRSVAVHAVHHRATEGPVLNYQVVHVPPPQLCCAKYRERS